MSDEQNNKVIKSFNLKKGIFIYISIILLIVGFSTGVWVGKHNAEIKIVSSPSTAEYGKVNGKVEDIPKFLSKDVEFRVFWDVWNIIQNKYIDRPMGETKLFYGALRGMVNSLNDPFSNFLEPQVASEFSDELNGKFEGVGMEIGIRNDVLTVISPLAESPAEKAGIRPADVIVEIDGYNTDKISLTDAVKRIRGEKGTTVKLKVYRSKDMEFLDIDVVRDVIKIVSVKLSTYTNSDFEILGDKKIAVIEVTNFNSDTSDRFTKAVQEVLLSNPDGLILDLRGNPGGFLDSAVEMSDWWIQKGDAVVREQFANNKTDVYRAASDPVLDKFKTVVLINGGSASGSEIVAGALQDYKLATLIGEQSFGKGSVQQLEDLKDGSVIKLTIARWLTPNSRTIDKEGITPDIEVEKTAEDFNNGTDPQLQRAIEFLVE